MKKKSLYRLADRQCLGFWRYAKHRSVKSLSGSDNIATDGVNAFSTLENIISELGQFVTDKRWVVETTKILSDW